MDYQQKRLVDGRVSGDLAELLGDTITLEIVALTRSEATQAYRNLITPR